MTGMGRSRVVKRRWRDYRTASGNRPVRAFIQRLGEHDRAAVLAAMAEVRELGNEAGRHLDGEIWEVRADGDRVTYRVLYASVGSKGRVLLALDAFTKKTQKTPGRTIELAKRRLRDWQVRGEAQAKDDRRR